MEMTRYSCGACAIGQHSQQSPVRMALKRLIYDARRVQLTQRLRTDSNGAIMVMGVFMAVFMVGLLYYLVGLGDAIWYRERMQDAADAAAYSSAAMHARGMNILALINIVMAAILAVLITLKLVAVLATIGAWVAKGLAPFMPILVPAVPVLEFIKSVTNNSYKNLKTPVFKSLEILHCVGVVLRGSIPLIAQGRVIHLVMTRYDRPDGPAKFAFVFPLYSALPTQDASYGDLCQRAAAYIGYIAEKPFSPLPDPIPGAIGDAVEGLSSAFALYFCGVGSGPPPSYEQEIKVAYPRLQTDAVKQCENRGNLSSKQHKEVCARAEQQMIEAMPDPGTRECSSQLCQQQLAAARRSCKPPKENMGQYRYTTQTVTLSITKLAGGVLRQREVERGPIALIGGERGVNDPPCPVSPDADDILSLDVAANEENDLTAEENRGLLFTETVRTPWNETTDGPLCKTKFRKPHPKDMNPGEETVVRYREVLEVFGCIQKTKQKFVTDEQLETPPDNDEVVVDDEGSGRESVRCGTGRKARVPQEMLEGMEQHGAEGFQVRAVALGEKLADADEGVRIARWVITNSPDDELRTAEDPWDIEASKNVAGLASRLSFAQAEYYYDGPESSEDWLWHMSWRARLRRFRLPAGGSSSPNIKTDSIGESCQAGQGELEGDICSDSQGILEMVNEVIVH